MIIIITSLFINFVINLAAAVCLRFDLVSGLLKASVQRNEGKGNVTEAAINCFHSGIDDWCAAINFKHE